MGDQVQKNIDEAKQKLTCSCCGTNIDFESVAGYHVRNSRRWCNQCFSRGHADTLPDICPNLPNFKKIQRVLDSVELRPEEAEAICKYVNSRVRKPPGVDNFDKQFA